MVYIHVGWFIWLQETSIASSEERSSHRHSSRDKDRDRDRRRSRSRDRDRDRDRHRDRDQDRRSRDKDRGTSRDKDRRDRDRHSQSKGTAQFNCKFSLLRPFLLMSLVKNTCKRTACSERYGVYSRPSYDELVHKNCKHLKERLLWYQNLT